MRRNVFFYLIDAVIGIAHYISDVQREKKGLPMRHSRYAGSFSGDKSTDHIFVEQMQKEAARNAEAERLRQQQEKYIYEDDGAEMGTIKAEGLMPPKEDEDNDIMDTI